VAKLNIASEAAILFILQEQITAAQELLYSLNQQVSFKPLELKTFQHQSVCGIYFQNLASFYQARKILAAAEIETFESNIRLEERYLMERFVCGSLEFVGQARQPTNSAKYTQSTSAPSFFEYDQVRIKPSNFIPKLSCLSLDIECSEFGELYSIGFHMRAEPVDYSHVIMIDSDLQQIADEMIHWVPDEKSLLRELEKNVMQLDPDIIIGWNVINFDFRLLHQRAAKYGMTLRLGRDHSAMRWRDSATEKNQGFVTIEGRVVIDGIAALKAEAYSFPSFSLQAMAEHFLGKSKLTEDVDNRMDTINHDFKHNKVKLAKYNLQDCVLVTEIFEQAKLLEYLILRSQLTGLELDRAGGSVAAFVNLYLPKLHRKGYVSPNLPEGGGLASPGGYVMNSKPGLYNNVLVLDFKSLYPSIIKTFKIDPLGLVEGLKNPDDAIQGFKDAYFSREEHLLPAIITDLWTQRDQAKKDKDQARSQAIKIIMNSFYGVLGSGGCPFYDTRLASSITLRGHEIMQRTAGWIEDKGLQVIYGDTDSTFVLLGDDYSDVQAIDLGNSLAEFINSQWHLVLTEEHQIDCHLEIEFETHFTKFLMPTIRGSEHGSKKRYAGLLKTNNGDKLVFKGLENVRTDWTQLAKDFQEQLYRMVFTDQNPQIFVKQTVEQTLAGERDTQLVFRKRLRRNLDSYVKNVPPHVKAARLADEQNSKLGKPLNYQNKGWICYLMTVQGPQPIEYLNAAIDYQFYIDRQIEPVADAILPFVGLTFKQIVDAQMGLF
jgi:DNA polymerase II